VKTFYRSLGDELVSVPGFEQGAWISLVSPDDAELEEAAAISGAPVDYLRAALDEEERSRIECELPGRTLIVIHVPVIEVNGDVVRYNTVPFGIVVTEDCLVTVCLRENPVLTDIVTRRAKGFPTAKRTRFLLHILSRTAMLYLHYLRQIDKRVSQVEGRLHRALKNEELIKLLNMEKSLVYFSTALKSNDLVIERLLRTKPLKMYPEDEDLLEDVTIENKQAIEMNETYSSILSGMMDAFASLISNNLNVVMKFLTAVTLVLAWPAMMGAFFGMNVTLPGQNHPLAFWGVMGVSVLLSGITAIYLAKRNMF
jgi:magnesium transporter